MRLCSTAPGPADASMTSNRIQTSESNQMTDNGGRAQEQALDRLVTTAGGIGAIALSSDGILIAKSAQFTKDKADAVAALASTLSSVAGAFQRELDGGPVRQTTIELKHQMVIVTAIDALACLALITPAEADLGVAAYEINRTIGGWRTPLSTEQRGAQPPLPDYHGRPEYQGQPDYHGQ